MSATPGAGPVPDPFQGDTLICSNLSPAERARAEAERVLAEAVIGRFARGDADRKLLTAVLFEPSRPSSVHGDKATPQEAAARREWLGRCRAWVERDGRVLSSSQIPKADQAAYTAATGDVWVPPGVQE